MLLGEIRNYLQEHRRVLLSDLANRFDTDDDALKGILQKWVSKGKVIKLSGDGACSSSCGKCDPSMIELYEWID